MTFDTRSFFVGIATVLGILLVGFGGGVMMGGVISGDSKAPNKIERVATKEPKPTEIKEAKPAPVPTVVAAPAQASPAAEPAPQSPPVVAAPPLPASAPAQVATLPRPEPQSQPALPAPQAQTVEPPAMGQEKQVSLAQPDEPLRPNLSRRDEARPKAQQRREERVLRREETRKQREEWRKRMVERRQQEQLRREEVRAVERSRPQEADDDDDVDERPIITRRERPFDLPFFRIFR
jgi:hypothetical protein